MKRICSLALALLLALALPLGALAADDVVWTQDTYLYALRNVYDNATVCAGVTVTLQNWSDPQGLEIGQSLTVEPGGRITGGCLIFYAGATCTGLDLYYLAGGQETLLTRPVAELGALLGDDYQPTFWFVAETGRYVLHGNEFDADPFELPPPAEHVIVRQDIPAAGTAVESRQTVELDGRAVELAAYALLDERGYPTNYVRLRDLALLMEGTAAQFDVTWSREAGIVVAPRHFYEFEHRNGTEGNVPFSGDQPYTAWLRDTEVAGRLLPLTAFRIEYDGGGHTYYQLRDLGRALDFNVGWTRERGMFIEPDKPYTDED